MTLPGVELTPPPASTDRVEIRHVRTQEEFAACVECQFATWGPGFAEVVPASMLKITQRLGGVTAGAFTGDGTLLGFVFGITGVERGEIVHWSDLLAVREDAQGMGLGRQLKEFQRNAVRAIGATRMYWTFDPLVARNAHFNLNRLGARVFEYVEGMYGSNTGSVLHSGFGTDRFIVTWPINASAIQAASQGAQQPARKESSPPLHEARAIPVVNAALDEAGSDPARFASSLPPHLHVEIPPDILEVNAASPDQARRWRVATRRALQWALANGYVVEGFEREVRPGTGAYLLSRASQHSALAPRA